MDQTPAKKGLTDLLNGNVIMPKGPIARKKIVKPPPTTKASQDPDLITQTKSILEKLQKIEDQAPPPKKFSLANLIGATNPVQQAPIDSSTAEGQQALAKRTQEQKRAAAAELLIKRFATVDQHFENWKVIINNYT